MIKVTKSQAQRIDRLCANVFAMDDKWIDALYQRVCKWQ